MLLNTNLLSFGNASTFALCVCMCVCVCGGGGGTEHSSVSTGGIAGWKPSLDLVRSDRAHCD